MYSFFKLISLSQCKEKVMNIFNQEELIDFEFPYKLWNSPPLCPDYPACPHNCKGVYGHMVAFCPQNSTARTTLRDFFSYSGSKIDMPLKPDMSEPVAILPGFEEVDHITYCSAIPISSGTLPVLPENPLSQPTCQSG